MKSILLKCPCCGKRFGVKRLTKKLVDKEASVEEVSRDFVGSPGGYGRAGQVYVRDTEEVPIQRDEYEVSYECSRFGHEWTDTVTVVERGS